MPKCSLFVSHTAVLSVEVIQGLAIDVEYRFFYLQTCIRLNMCICRRGIIILNQNLIIILRDIILSINLINLTDYLIFRGLRKRFIYQAFLRTFIQLKTASFKCALSIIESKLRTRLADIVAHCVPSCYIRWHVWATLVFLFHDIRAALSLLVHLNLTLF